MLKITQRFLSFQHKLPYADFPAHLFIKDLGKSKFSYSASQRFSTQKETESEDSKLNKVFLNKFQRRGRRISQKEKNS